MSRNKSFYITTTLPYVNAEPHIGFAMELIRADVIARWKKLNGFEVFFNTGTDEHGLKIYRKAKEGGIDVGKFVDQHSQKFKSLIELLNIDQDIHFIRTTDERHVKAAQELWRRCKINRDIEKKIYKTKYCVGCELEKTDSELVDDKCPTHPNLDIEVREEENYFFKFSKYRRKLLDLYKSNPNFVVPDSRFNEIKLFVERGVEDFSISRLKDKMPWGVSVPDDPDHVMYVWFDALVSYISTLGWPSDEENFKKFWMEGTPTQYAGKDNLRQQAAMWQAMLMSAGLPPSNQIIINGFINSGGQKMSKSLGNVIDPQEVVNRYGAEVLRYFVCRELSTFEDSDFTWERIHEAYNAHLANGLGNLVSRIMTMTVTNNIRAREFDFKLFDHAIYRAIDIPLDQYKIGEAMDHIWSLISISDNFIQTDQPFKTIKTNRIKAEIDIKTLILYLIEIAVKLRPFMPDTAKEIQRLIEEHKIPKRSLFIRRD